MRFYKIKHYIVAFQVDKIVDENMEKGLINYAQDDYQGVTKTWDIVQHEVSELSYVFLGVAII